MAKSLYENKGMKTQNGGFGGHGQILSLNNDISRVQNGEFGGIVGIGKVLA
jgi:hypothetical protein